MTDTEMAVAAGATDHEALRARVNELRVEHRLSIRQMADEAGIANGTFSNWLGGTYQGDNDKVAKQVTTWLEARPTRARIQAASVKSPDFVATPTSETFIGTLEHAQYMPDMALVIGAPGLGKTFASTAYAARNPNVWMVTAEPCGATVRSMLELIGSALRVPAAGVSASKLSLEIVRRMRGVNGLLLVDEAQHLGAPALDQLRTLHDLSGCGVALVGNESIFARIDGSGRHFAQLSRRVGMRTTRMKPSPRDVALLIDAWGVTDADSRRVLHAVAQKPGALGLMDKVLRFAHKQALGEGETKPRADHVRAAFARLSSDGEHAALRGVA